MSENHLTKEDKDETLSKVEAELIKNDPKIFEGINPHRRQQIVKSVFVTMQKIHVGPLPAPETLREYSELIPNGAERIMSMAEKQQNHRMGLEKRVIRGQVNQSFIGQVFAFLIGLATIWAASYCAINGHEIFGSILGIGGLTSLVTAFIQGRKSQEKDLKNKSPQNRR